MFNLAGKKALVTGASQGIGEAIAYALAAANAEVILSARNESALNKVANTIRDGGGRARVIAADLSSRSACRDLAAQCGDVDILINNAALTQMSMNPITGESDEYWDLNINLSLIAPVTLMQALMPGMAKRGSGSVVNISSIVAVDPPPLMAPYASMKAALEIVTKSAALELARQGVRVNAIRCGLIGTENLAHFMREPEIEKTLLANVPAGRTARPKEVADLCVYLNSQEAEIITGAVYTIDGGMTAGQFLHLA